MLYLDSSVLIKRYVREPGTASLNARLLAEGPANSYTSVVAFAEIQATFARRRRDGIDSVAEAYLSRRQFERDWGLAFGYVALDSQVLVLISRLVEGHPLRGLDAIHLASALWLRNSMGQNRTGRAEIFFATSDRQLRKAAAQLGFQVLDPEAA